MESSFPLAEIESIAADEECNHPDWYRDASFAWVDHQYMIVCKRWKQNKHYDCEVIDYQTPKDLSTLTLQVVAMVTHISEDWTLLNYDAKVK